MHGNPVLVIFIQAVSVNNFTVEYFCTVKIFSHRNIVLYSRSGPPGCNRLLKNLTTLYMIKSKRKCDRVVRPEVVSDVASTEVDSALLTSLMSPSACRCSISALFCFHRGHLDFSLSQEGQAMHPKRIMKYFTIYTYC